jgi:hypothetical protein
MKDIDGYEGLYAITKDGRVWSYKKKGWKKLQINENGYACVLLSNNGIAKHKYVHRLVGEAYIPNPENKPTIDHIKKNQRCNNNLDNLRWATYKEQAENKDREDFATYGFKGKKHTQEAKDKLSKLHKGKKKSIQHRKNLSKAKTKYSEGEYFTRKNRGIDRLFIKKDGKAVYVTKDMQEGIS